MVGSCPLGGTGKRMTDLKVTIPIEIVIRVGEPVIVVTGATVAALDQGERFVLDDAYDARSGYDARFLNRDTPVALPTLTDAAMKTVSLQVDVEPSTAHVLRYHHFSIVMHRKRRLLHFAASNTTRDPGLVGKKSRKDVADGASDKWILDPRIPAFHQVTTAELYKKIHFDRGHIVRRDDNYWGLTEEEAQYGNFDSFHYTNCTPQHPAYNRSNKKGLWGELENQIAAQAEENGCRMSLFSGPVLSEDDPRIDGFAVPREFWKIVVVRRKRGELGAWAFLLSQSRLVARARRELTEGVTFDPEQLAVYQVPVKRIESLTDVRFDDAVRGADAYAGDTEAALPGDFVEIERVEDIRL
jgi:endonuclease G